MTDSSETPNIEEWIDRIILDLAHRGSFMQKGKTINADMFPEAKQALLAKFQEERKKAVDEALQKILAAKTREYGDLSEETLMCDNCHMILEVKDDTCGCDNVVRNCRAAQSKESK